MQQDAAISFGAPVVTNLITLAAKGSLPDPKNLLAAERAPPSLVRQAKLESESSINFELGLRLSHSPHLMTVAVQSQQGGEIMQLFIFEAIVNGFGSGEIDLATRLAQDQAQASVFNSEIIDNIVDVLRSPDAGAALSVAGHADRDDTAGLSHIQHLAIEKTASENRVTNAIAHIHQLVQQQEPTAPSDLNTLAFFDVNLRAPGAGVLVEDGAALSEAQRRMNRRIQARLLVFKP